MLLLLIHLNVMGNSKLVPGFVGPFSIVQWVGPLALQLNLGNCYSQVHPIFYVSLLKLFNAAGDGYLHPTVVYIKDKQECGEYLSVVNTSAWHLQHSANKSSSFAL